jgi:hypothetical protein
MTGPSEIAVLRIELEDIEPLIWRRVAVPTSINLKGLHRVIQAAMGWLDYHLWEFTADGIKYGMLLADDRDWNERIEERNYKIQDKVGRNGLGMRCSNPFRWTFLMKLRLEARVSSDSPDAVGRFLVAKFGATSVTQDGSDWIVHAEVGCTSARDANRELLSELRRVERKTRLRAEWTSGGSVERFFDYVPKGRRPANR